MDMPVTDRISNLLTTFLDVQSRRAQIISGNIANAETPGYKAKQLEFGSYLKNAAMEAMTSSGTDNAGSTSLDSPKIVDQVATTIGVDGNTVDLSKEMSSMAEAGMQYLTGTQLLQARFKTLRTAIREGK
jgi:flagellar basal-body rod protein FlgB